MIRQLTLVGILLGALAMPAMAERRGGGVERGPDALVRRSIHHIRGVTHRSVRAMGGQARRCTMAIAQLLENEEADQAAEVAARCIEGINEVAQRGVERIGSIVERSISVLTELEAPPALGEAIRGAGERAAGVIRERRAAIIERVESALAG